MTGIVFPSFINSIAPIMQMEQNDRRNALAEKAYAREEEDRVREREAAADVPAALAGDKEALGRVSAKSPRTAFALAPLLERADAATRARAKEASLWTQQAALGVLSAPPEQRAAAYAAALEDGRARGYDISKLPPQYSPQVEGRLNFYVGQARDANKWFEENDKRPTPIGPAPGGFVGQVSRDESGGNYNIPNAKGSGAYGKYQFMPETWASVAQANPHLNLPVNMRQATPQQQEAAMEALTRSNGQALLQAGVPATSANLYLAHRFGVGGTTKFLSASDDAPIATLFPPVWIQQNPDLNTTVGQFKRGVQSRYGGIPAGREVAMGGSAAPMPEPPGGMAVPGTPAQMPAGPPGLAQGDAVPADANGSPAQPSQSTELFAVKDWLSKTMPGARPMGNKRTGMLAYDSKGRLMVQKPDGTEDFVEVPNFKERQEQSGGPFSGTSMDAQAMNVLITGDPASPQYALAYSHLSKPRTTIDTEGRAVTIQPMDLSSVRKPTGTQAAPAPGAPAGTTTQPLPGGGSVSVSTPVAPKGPTAKEQADLRTARIEAKKMTDALEDFRKQFSEASVGDRAKSLTGTTTPLNTSYNVAALLAKGEQLFNLGVLNGPDLEIIRRTLPDPSTIRGAATSSADMSAAVDKVIAVLNGALAERERQLGATGAPADPAKGAVPQGADRERTLFDARKAIQHGAPRDAVIERLRSMGIEPEGL